MYNFFSLPRWFLTAGSLIPLYANRTRILCSPTANASMLLLMQKKWSPLYSNNLFRYCNWHQCHDSEYIWWMQIINILEELQSFMQHNKCTKCQLFSLIGKLSFACKVVPAGHIFLYHFLDLNMITKHLHHRSYILWSPTWHTIMVVRFSAKLARIFFETQWVQPACKLISISTPQG